MQRCLPALPTALALLACAASGQSTSPRQALTRLIDDPALATAHVGVMVRDLHDGSVLCAHQAAKAFMPASTMKLVTAATALTTLGPDHRFETLLVTRPSTRIEDGVLHGDIELVGAGDPSLGAGPSPTAVFRTMARALRDKGIKRIDGRVLGNDDCQPDEVMGEGWAWDDETKSYAAPIGGLCFAENCFAVVVTAGAVGAAPAVETSPGRSYVEVVCAARSATKPRSTLRIERDRHGNRVLVRGEIKAGKGRAVRRFSVANPTAFAASVLRETLIAEGIAVTGAALDEDDAKVSGGSARAVLARHRSAPLSELLLTLNKSSQNLFAEQLVRAAARAGKGRADMPSATRHARDTLQHLGVDTAGMCIADGSGLSRLDLVRPAQMTGLLAAMWRDEHRTQFVDSLPIAGVDGTLRSRMRGTAAHRRVRAKTGTLRHVVALAGYVPRPEADRPPLAFCVVLNHFDCSERQARRSIDRFVAALAEWAGWPVAR